MTVLVTGAGIIGTMIAGALHAKGRRVVLLDIRPNHAAIGSLVADAPIDVVVGDICDAVFVERLAADRGVEAIVHTAALLTSAIAKDPRRGVEVNVMGTANVLEAARRLRMKRVILSSSTTLAYPTFGAGETGPLHEDFAIRIVSERPMNLYSATKLFDEHLAAIYAAQFGVDAIAVRYAAVLGDWAGPNNSIPGTLLRVFRSAIRERKPAVFDEPRLAWLGGDEFVDARDCAAATVAALDAPAPKQRVFTISSGILSTFDDFVAAARRLYPALEVKLTFERKGGFAGFPHIRRFPSDISAAARELGFVPKFDLASSLRHYLAPDVER
jgi:UDP-glucose 4-epimerase